MTFWHTDESHPEASLVHLPKYYPGSFWKIKMYPEEPRSSDGAARPGQSVVCPRLPPPQRPGRPLHHTDGSADAQWLIFQILYFPEYRSFARL